MSMGISSQGECFGGLGIGLVDPLKERTRMLDCLEKLHSRSLQLDILQAVRGQLNIVVYKIEKFSQ